MPKYQNQKALPTKAKWYQEEDEWNYLEEGFLKKACSACVCITCNHFGFSYDKQGRTLLLCHMSEKLIPHGEHLYRSCHLWSSNIDINAEYLPEVV